MNFKILVLFVSLLVLLKTTRGRTLGVKGGPAHLRTPPKPDRDVLRVAESNNHFALEVYRILSRSASKDQNLALCPISLTSLVSMLYLGATGNTAAEINATLGYYTTGLNEEELSEGFRKATEVLISRTNGSTDYRSTLRLASSVWIQKTKAGVIQKAFTDDLIKYFKAMVMEVDFKDPSTRTEINNWANKATDGLIPSVLDSNPSPSTRILLASAIFYTSKWETQFNKSSTTQDLFKISPTQSVPVPMMHQRFHRIRHGYNAAFKAQVIELPYQAHQTTMLIVLPDENVSLDSIEAQLNPQSLMDLVSKMMPTSVTLSMPRFEIQDTLQLKDTLSSAGLSSLFDPTKAELQGIDSRGDLYVSDVFQKIVVKVNEEGTKAAAVTASVNNRKVPRRATVTVDRPFLFLIGHVQTGAILFMGRVNKP